MEGGSRWRGAGKAREGRKGRLGLRVCARGRGLGRVRPGVVRARPGRAETAAGGDEPGLRPLARAGPDCEWRIFGSARQGVRLHLALFKPEKGVPGSPRRR